MKFVEFQPQEIVFHIYSRAYDIYKMELGSTGDEYCEDFDLIMEWPKRFLHLNLKCQ